jgi:hypothetical protein
MMHGKARSGTAPISLASPNFPTPPRKSSRKACRTRVCCLFMWKVLKMGMMQCDSEVIGIGT